MPPFRQQKSILAPDDTIRLSRTPQGGDHRSLIRLAALTGIAAVILAGILVAFIVRPAGIPKATEAQILRDHPRGVRFFRYRSDPAILVIDFPGLHSQGLMMDRIAALTEKAGEPRDRVLTFKELHAALTAADETVGTYYYGNDYPAAALAKFFRLADVGHIRLNPPERRLERRLRRLGWLKPGANGAVITLPAAGGRHRVTMRDRAVILRHELSHGAFFTIPAFRAYAAHFWADTLSPGQRRHFRSFLAGEGYDTTNQTLVINESQAYLVFTPDRQFFSAAAIRLPAAEVAGLRATFIRSMPDFWLRKLAVQPLPETP